MWAPISIILSSISDSMTTQFLTFVTLHAVQSSGTRAITGHVITGGFFRTRTCLGTVYTIELFRAFLIKLRSK